MVRNLMVMASLVAALTCLPGAQAQGPRPGQGPGSDPQAQIRRLEDQLERLQRQIKETEAALKEAKVKAEKDKAEKTKSDAEKAKADKEKPDKERFDGRGRWGMGGFGGFGGWGHGGFTPPASGSKSSTEDINAKLDRIAKELEEIRREMRNRR